jgi:hypothetical protein
MCRTFRYTFLHWGFNATHSQPSGTYLELLGRQTLQCTNELLAAIQLLLQCGLLLGQLEQGCCLLCCSALGLTYGLLQVRGSQAHLQAGNCTHMSAALLY